MGDEAFTQVKRYLDYESYDAVRDRRLVDGEELEVMWPDGSVERVRVRVFTSTERREGRGGMDETTSDTRASVVVPYRGTWALVALRDSRLFVRRVAK